MDLDKPRRRYATFLKIFLPPLTVLLIFQGISIYADIPMMVFLLDPWNFNKLPVFIGALSSLGVFIMCAASAICFFTYALLKRNSLQVNLRRFMFFSAAFSLLFVLDDFFLLHEVVVPRAFGIGQSSFMAIYPAAAIVCAVLFARTIVRTEYFILLIALVLFGTSFVLDWEPISDLFIENDTLKVTLANYEEWLKFLGISVWLGYVANTSYWTIKREGLPGS